MKKAVLLFSIIFYTLLSVNLFSQEITGKIIYAKVNYIPKTKVDSNIETEFNDLKKRITEVSKHLEYILVYKNEKSHFNLNEKLNLDYNNSVVRMASTISGGGGVYYTNSETRETIQQRNVGGQNFLIVGNFNLLEWTLINETKLIGKYLCYKATTTKEFIGKKTTYKEIVVWYCPNLTSAFGPIGYGGLPGLILELQIEKGATFTAKKIINNPKKIKIILPTKGKKVNEKEFEESCKQMMMSRRG